MAAPVAPLFFSLLLAMGPAQSTTHGCIAGVAGGYDDRRLHRLADDLECLGAVRQRYPTLDWHDFDGAFQVATPDMKLGVLALTYRQRTWFFFRKEHFFSDVSDFTDCTYALGNRVSSSA